MASRLIQVQELPDGYKLYVYDSGHSSMTHAWIDAELSSPDWIAFTARVSVPILFPLSSSRAAAYVLEQMLTHGGRLHKTLTDDQRDFLASTESIKLRNWCDSVNGNDGS